MLPVPGSFSMGFDPLTAHAVITSIFWSAPGAPCCTIVLGEMAELMALTAAYSTGNETASAASPSALSGEPQKGGQPGPWLLICGVSTVSVSILPSDMQAPMNWSAGGGLTRVV